MNIPLNEKQKQELLQKFKALQTLEEKLSFWQEELKQEYIKFLLYMDGTDNLPKELDAFYSTLLEFRIYPKPSEYKAYNLSMLERYNLVFGMLRPKKKLLSLKKLIKDFEKRSGEVLYNRKEFLEKELEEVKLQIEARSKATSSDSYDNSPEFFKYTFQELYHEGKQVDYSKDFYDILNLIAIHEASVYADYIDYLQEELTRAGKNTSKRAKEISLNQQLLLLDYLGIMEQLTHPDTSKRAEFISLLLNKSYQNVRTTITYYRNLKTSKIDKEKEAIRKDLQEVERLLQEQGLDEAAKKVKADIEKLSK